MRTALASFARWSGLVLLPVAVVVLVGARGLAERDEFAGRLMASLLDARVRAWTTDRLTDAAVSENESLLPARPLVRVVVGGMVGTSAFRAVVRRAALESHRGISSRLAQRLALAAPDISLFLRSTLGHLNPEVAARISPRLERPIVALGASGPARAVTAAARVSRTLANVAFGAVLAAVVLLTIGTVYAPDRRGALRQTALGLVAGALALAAMRPAGRVVAMLGIVDPVARGAAAGLWSAYFASLVGWSLLLGVVGVVILAASASALDELSVRGIGRRAVSLIAEPPAAAGWRLAWAAGLIVLGTLCLLAPLTVAAAAVSLLGVGIALMGARELLRPMLTDAAGAGVDLRQPRRPLATAVAVVATLLAVGGLGWLLWRNRPVIASAAEVLVCNGSAALCDRPLGDVVFAGTHNAMGNAEVTDWMFPSQLRGIPRQLRDGVRAFQIDVHYGVPGGARIKTELEAEAGMRTKMATAVGPEATEIAVRIRNTLVGVQERKRGLYFCHGFCELGAYVVGPTFASVADFLARNPGEVILMVVEDYVEPAELAAAMDSAGLARFAYRGPAGPPWPTLGEMVRSNQRLVVFLESGRTGVRWMFPAFVAMQETPFTFFTPEEMSCVPNRGGTSGGLFQFNHWIETTPAPRPANAAVVNAREFLLERIKRCERERGLRATIVAVDFYDRGQLLEVVRELNGLTPIVGDSVPP